MFGCLFYDLVSISLEHPVDDGREMEGGDELTFKRRVYLF